MWVNICDTPEKTLDWLRGYVRDVRGGMVVPSRFGGLCMGKKSGVIFPFYMGDGAVAGSAGHWGVCASTLDTKDV